jgi:iron complex outermembrane receptor protein
MAAAALPWVPAASMAQATAEPVPAVVVQGHATPQQGPATSESINAAKIADTINAMTAEDALKYMPSVLIRRRFIGDTQAPMATRTTGINASARSLVYADGVPLSALVNNNNQNGSPQWFMVSPDEIARVAVLYGPYAASYPGNSYGAVTEIVTRMPKHFEGSARIGLSSQDFSQYGASDRYPATQASVNVGDRSGDWSWWVSANHLSSFSQPVTYLTANQSASAAAADSPVITGAVPDRNRSGAPIQVFGAGNLTHTVQDAAKVKLAYQVSPATSASYLLGYWQNGASASSKTYLKTAGGAPWFGGSGTASIGGKGYAANAIASLFSSNTTDQAHWMQALALKSKAGDAWGWEAVATHVEYGKDLTRTSTGPYPAAQAAGSGRIADAGGTRWTTLDLKGSWDEPGAASPHSVTFGAHFDQYQLANPTYNTGDWVHGDKGSLFSDSRGKTLAQALWGQDAWQLTPMVSATLGARYEWWRAYDGFNFSTSANGSPFPVNQPQVSRTGLSPKASFAWQEDPALKLTASFGKALRFPTVGELYQNVQTGQTFTQANPFLRPEKVLSAELAAERKTVNSRLRVSLFEEHVSDALIAQTSTIAGIAVPVSFVQNVDKTRQRGFEVVGKRSDLFLRGLELDGSLTWVNAKIKANSGYVPTIPGATSVGKRTPYVPEWRATATATYRPDARWTYTLAGRYSTRLYATVDNTDVNPATYQGFDSYLVLDTRVRYLIDKHWSAAAGVDNLNNRKYFLFHPFPQRTLNTEVKYEF